MILAASLGRRQENRQTSQPDIQIYENFCACLISVRPLEVLESGPSRPQGRRSQVVRQKSAKLLFTRSIRVAASKKFFPLL